MSTQSRYNPALHVGHGIQPALHTSHEVSWRAMKYHVIRIGETSCGVSVVTAQELLMRSETISAQKVPVDRNLEFFIPPSIGNIGLKLYREP